jgi:Tfp pilus assembly protein PilF
MRGQPDPIAARQRIRSAVFFPAFIFVLAFLQYANTFRHDYAWDDKLVITANPYTIRGVAAIPEIFAARVSVPYKNEYRPVPQAMFALEYEASGGNPHVGHVFNVLWYAATCVVVYWFVQFALACGDVLFPFCVALLFAVHPLHVEVVANIKSRDEILSLFFGLSAVMLAVKAIEQWNGKFLLGTVPLFVLALLSKSDAVTLLPVIALVAWYRAPEWRMSRKLALAGGVIALCTTPLVLLIRYSQNTVSPKASAQLSSTVLNNIFLWSKHPHQITPTSIVIIGRYLRLFLYPHPLIQLYGYDQIPLNRWSDAPVLILVIVFGAMVWWGFKHWREKPTPMFGVIFFAVTYSVYSNFLFLAPDTMADRYLFMPSLGLAIALVWSLFRLASIDLRRAPQNGARVRWVGAGFLLLLCAYSARTFVANRDWENDSTLIFNRIRYMTNNAAAEAIDGFMLNRASAEAPSAELAREDKIEAMKAFTRAIEIYPEFYGAWISVGKIFAQQGMNDKAELAFLRAQRLEPLSSDGYLCLGILHLAQRDENIATMYLEKAVLLDPQEEEAYVMLGRTYLEADKIENLGSMAMTATKWFPQNLELRALLATYYFRKQDYKQAINLARSVLSRDPQNFLAMAILSSPAAQNF